MATSDYSLFIRYTSKHGREGLFQLVHWRDTSPYYSDVLNPLIACKHYNNHSIGLFREVYSARKDRNE